MRATSFFIAVALMVCFSLLALQPAQVFGRDPAPEELAKARKDIARLGGTCNTVYEHNLSGKTYILKLPGKATDDALRLFPEVPFDFTLDLSQTKVTDVGLKELKTIKYLTGLSLIRTQVTDVGLKELGRIERLGWLNLCGARITDKGLTELENCQNLSWLMLNDTRVTGVGLKGLKNLTWLSLAHTSLSAAGLRELKNLTRLKRLDISGTEVTPALVLDLEKALADCEIIRPMGNYPPRKTKEQIAEAKAKAEVADEEKYEKQSKATLSLAKRWLDESKAAPTPEMTRKYRDKYLSKLRELIEKFPDTAAAAEANRLLREK